ncbi:MAG: hypothetical protein PHX87_02975 [Candidatus Peribacteraceae bacterium]|nr:hypothetical protein [Candidatus Peribacteraceae bacterium]MDD5742371.1 hypothetical protein [Candidatus Peribacteraceae bacterium]
MVTFADNLSDVLEQDSQTTETLDPEKEVLAHRRSALVQYFRGFMAETFDKLHVASAEETAQLHQGLMHIGLTEQEIGEWERYRDEVAERQRESARELSDHLHTQLDRANAEHTITRESRQRWLDRFEDASLNYKAKEYFVLHQLPSYLAAWERVAKKRVKLLHDPRIKSLTKADVSDMETFLKGKEFLDLHFEKRADLNARIEAAMTAKTRKIEHLHNKAKSALETAAAAGAINHDRLGRWLLEKLRKFPTAMTLQDFVEHQLPEYIKNWMKLRTEYDWVEAKMKENSVPQGFNRLSPEKFLLLSYNQRRSYVEQAKQRLNLTEAPSPRAMENIKLGIRHALDTKDWDEAEDLLGQARKLFEQGKGVDRDRFELDSMERYLKEFRTKEHEEEQPMQNAHETLEQTRMAYDQIPRPLQPLYLSAMNDPDKLGAIAACTYNRVWCREHGYLTDDREKELEQEATTTTQALARQGKHNKKGLDNVKLGVVTDKQHDPAVRRYDEGEWGPTIIHMPPETHQHFLSILETRKSNHAFRYWTTLIPTDVTYEQQLHLVRNLNWVLKSGVKKLKEQGIPFSLTDSMVPRSLQKSPSKSAQHQSLALSA